MRPSWVLMVVLAATLGLAVTSGGNDAVAARAAAPAVSVDVGAPVSGVQAAAAEDACRNQCLATHYGCLHMCSSLPMHRPDCFEGCSRQYEQCVARCP